MRLGTRLTGRTSASTNCCLLAKKELDQERRAEMYREMCMLAKDDGGTIIPMFTNFVYARRNNVQHGPSLASSWELDGARGYHRWWFT